METAEWLRDDKSFQTNLKDTDHIIIVSSCDFEEVL